MEERPTKLDYYLNIAHKVASRGTCPRLKVGAILVTRDSIVATGYNGAPRGMPHCSHVVEPHYRCTKSVHAEMNAIINAGRDKALGSTMYITHAPCLACSGPLINVGVLEVYFEEYYKNTEGLDNLHAAGLYVSHRPRPTLEKN